MTRVRRVLVWLLVAFLVYAIYQDPDGAAASVEQVWGVIQTAFDQLTDFFDALID